MTTVQLYGTPFDAFNILSPETLPRSANPTAPGTFHVPFPRLRTLTLAKMPYLSIDLDDLKLLRRFLLERTTLARKNLHARLHTLRLDRTILEAFRAASKAGGAPGSLGVEGGSEDTFFEDWEDDEDYAEGLEGDGFTDADGATDFEGEPNVPFLDDEDDEEDGNLDELADDAAAAVGDEDPSDADDFSVDIEAGDDADESSEDSEDDDEVELDEVDEANVAAHVTAPLASSEPEEEEDELASNGPPLSSESEEPEDGEEWIRRHVDVLEAIDYDWRAENP